MSALATVGFLELEQLIGRALPVDSYHGSLRRTAQGFAGVRTFGVLLVTCSDECQGEFRSLFDRDVARPLMSASATGQRRIFAVSNLGGRIEPGALKLADEHFTARAREPKLMLVSIAAHCGVRTVGHAREYGMLERLGQSSPCCGALSLLVGDDEAAAAVRHPWFDQLSAFFGPERLAGLRADSTPTRMLSASVLHAVLQAETAVTDLLREPPPSPTQILISSTVVLNHSGADEVLPVAVHHLASDGRELQLVRGRSLRSTPSALRFKTDAGRLRVECDELVEALSVRRAVPQAAGELHAALDRLKQGSDEPARERAARVERQVRHARAQVQRLKQHPAAWRAYARPLLRGVVQGLSLAAPEIGLAAMLVQTGHDALRAERLRQLLRSGPSSVDARNVLKHIEAEIAQLGHREAQDVLELLISENHGGAR